MAKQQLQTSRKFPKLHIILDQLLQVADTCIEQRMSPETITALDSATIEAADQYQPYWKVCCNKTGQPLHFHSIELIKQLAAIHKPSQIDSTLQALAVNYTAPAWLYTDSSSLLALSKAQPEAYFIHAASLFLDPYIKQATCKQRWEFQQQKQTCYQQAVSGQVSLKLIITANELLRRYLGLILPNKLHLPGFRTMTAALAELTSSNDKLLAFINTIRATLKTVILSHINTKRAYPNKRLSQITHAALTEVQTTYTGRTDFRQQVRLKSLSKTDAVLYELQEIWEENFSAASKGWDTVDTIPLKAKKQQPLFTGRLNLTTIGKKRVVQRTQLSNLLAGKQPATIHTCAEQPVAKLQFGNKL